MKFFGIVAVGIHYFFWLIALNRCCIVVATTDDDLQLTRLRGKGDEFSGIISDNLQLDEEVFWARTLEGSFGESEGEGEGENEGEGNGSESKPLSTSTLSSPDNNAKYPRVAAAKSAFYLRSCLLNVFQNATVNYVGDDTLPKVVFSPNTATSKDFNLTEYNTARGIQNYGTSLPGAVLFAENTEDILHGVNCARSSGYVVSPRGTGHSWQGVSTADGTLVIDTKLTCKPDNITVVSREKGDGILPGTKYAGIMKVPSGCTNALLLAAVGNSDNYDPEEGAMAVIGSCPSVGVTGYLLGGGLGDVTPWAGTGSDQVKAFDIVLFDGTVITEVSSNNHEELYWAARGGGGGFGVITNLYIQNVISPSPTAFTFIWVTYKADNTTKGEFAVKFQNFQYDNLESPKFGGAAGPNSITGIYLGTWEEAIKMFTDAKLLDGEMFNSSSGLSLMTEDYNPVCGDATSSPCNDITSINIPQYGIQIHEVKTQVEAETLIIIFNWFRGGDVGGGAFGGTEGLGSVGRSLNICEDLRIDNSFCTEPKSGYDFNLNVFATGQKCSEFLDAGILAVGCLINFLLEDEWYTKEVVQAFLALAPDITSFVNNHGIAESVAKSFASEFDPNPYSGTQFAEMSTFGQGPNFGPGSFQLSLSEGPNAMYLPDASSKPGEVPPFMGGMMFPRLTDDVMRELGEAGGFQSQHLTHGANLQADKSASAFPWRNSAVLNGNGPPALRLDIILKDPFFNNDPTKLQAYYPYLGPIAMSNPSFLQYHWNTAETVNRISAVRDKYDPIGGFDNLAYVPRGTNFLSEAVCDNNTNG